VVPRHTRERTDRFVPDDFQELEPSRVRRALLVASSKILSRLVRLMRPFGNPPLTPKTVELMRLNPVASAAYLAEIKRLGPDWAATSSYLGLDLPKPKRDKAWYLEWCLELGLKPKEAMFAADICHKQKRGAPVTARQAAVKALDLRLEDPRKWTWKRLGAEFCTSSGPAHYHDAACQQRIRQAVIHLEKLLQRHNVHPNAKYKSESAM
jgi:hypothetical protein